MRRTRATTRPLGFVCQAITSAITTTPSENESIENESIVDEGRDQEPITTVAAKLAVTLGESHALLDQLHAPGADAASVLLSYLTTSVDVVERPISEDASAVLDALVSLEDRATVPALYDLLARQAPGDRWPHALVHALVPYGEHLVVPGLNVAANHPGVRLLVVETFALARVADERALALAFALLDELPAQIAELLMEWRDARALRPLRERMARMRMAEPNWLAIWALTDAMLQLGAPLLNSERDARRAAFANEPALRRSGFQPLLRVCEEAMTSVPGPLASVIADLGGDDAISLLRRRLARFDQRWEPWSTGFRPELRFIDRGSAQATLQLLEALVAAGGELEPREVAMRAHALSVVASDPHAPFGERRRSDEEIEEQIRAERLDEERRLRDERDEEARPSFPKDFDAALLSLDETVIRRLEDKWPMIGPWPSSLVDFWGKVHWLRAALQEFPYDARALSRAWLSAHGFELPADPDFDELKKADNN